MANPTRAEELAINAIERITGKPAESADVAIFVDRLRTYGELVRAEDAEVCEKSFPSNWCDPLLTGPKAPIKDPNCPQIEAYTNAVKDRCAAAIKSEPLP